MAQSVAVPLDTCHACQSFGLVFRFFERDHRADGEIFRIT